MKKSKQVTLCRICKSVKLYKFFTLGNMPLPNGFLKKEELKKIEKRYELSCFLCEYCGLVQLSVVVHPNLMFKNYAYIPSTSKVMLNNFSSLAHQVNKILRLKRNSMVVDIGSNDGTLLSFFKGFGCKILGVDPAENIAPIAENQGIPTLVKLFTVRTAKNITKQWGKADVMTATNVVAHIDNLHSLLRGVVTLLKGNGLFITEFPYLLDLVSKNQFDTIYHEHLSYFSLKPWKHLIEQFGLEIIDIRRLPVHGGSIRLTHRFSKKKHNNPAIKTVEYLISLEKQHGLHDKAALEQFTKRILDLKEELRYLLRSLKQKKKRIVGYGAAAKGNVLTNFFDIGPETLEYIVDSIPYKHGLYTPGKHIPVYPEERLFSDMPDYALILAWNFADEIIAKQKEYQRRGGKFILPIPNVRIV